ncbi:hypothetical protein [Bradyrhizobium australafricanum]|uniref:hypothetical protein n=1 Tax=Bradyrhizobium australafricanum TaxID=2821406 RepID=UPI001CE29DE8|nr:hypothetical protein [Bradyrhizobium australafricanum]MCA6099193.1 hypothetical protein [Bradyrhizobium australafricanum]
MASDQADDAAITEAASIIAATLRRLPTLLPVVEAACTAVAAILKNPKLGDDIAIALIGTRNPTLIPIGEGIAKIAAEVQVLNGEHEHGRTN